VPHSVRGAEANWNSPAPNAGLVPDLKKGGFKMKKAILIIVAVLLISPVVVYFAFPGKHYLSFLKK
jgi:hypothetical protein